ncbi:MAG: hypothetical protein QXR31_06355, partial [Zestosphaera sp.]
TYGPHNVYEALKTGARMTAYGEVENPKLAEQTMNRIAMQTIGRTLTPEEAGFFWKHFGGVKGRFEIGKFERALIGMQAIESLKDQEARSFFESKGYLFSGNLQSRVAQTDALIDSGVLSVKWDDKSIFFSIKGGDNKGEVLYRVDVKEGKAALLDYVPYQDLSVLHGQVERTFLETAISKDRELIDGFRKMLERGDAKYKIGETKQTYEKKFEEALRSGIQEEIKQNEALRNAMKEAGITERQLETYLKAYARKGGDIKILGIGVGLGVEAGGRVSSSDRHSLEKSTEVASIIENAIRKVLDKAKTEAISNTFSTALADGRKREELEKFAKEIGATEVLEGIKRWGTGSNIDTSVTRNLLVSYLRHLGEKKFGGDYYAAKSYIDEQLSSDAGTNQLAKELAEFAKQYHYRQENVKAIMGEMDRMRQQLNQDFQEVSKQVKGKIPSAGSISKQGFPAIPYRVSPISQDDFYREKQKQSKLIEEFTQNFGKRYSNFWNIWDLVKDYQPTDEDRAKVIEGIVRSGGIVSPDAKRER